MLSVSLIFLYMLLTAYCIGFLTLSGIGWLCAKAGRSERPAAQWRAVKADSYVMAGLVTVTVYAQLFSLFYKVGAAANFLLLLVCGITAVCFHGELKEALTEQYRSMTKGTKGFYLVLFLLFAYGTSRGIIHYDTGLYHAQSIRWIEEYGVVKGLGNLHCRLAYNSSAFSLSALYSFAFLGGQSYHCAAGFFALLLAKVCGEIAAAWRRKRLVLSDVVRLMGIYYLLMIFDEMVSPASDYFMVLTVFYIVIRYLDLVELGENSWMPYGLLALVCVYTVSIKLSAAFIILLAVKPAVMLIKDRNGRGILCFCGLGILIIAPYLIRNVLISGWLVYPFTFLDFFAVDWKIPKGIADYDAREIQVWGRGIQDVARYGEPVFSWFGGWFASQGRIDRLFILLGIGAAPVSAAAWTAAAVRREEKLREEMLAAVTVSFSFLFWLLSAPLMRYGCVYVWLAAPVTFGGLLFWMLEKRAKGRRVETVFWRVLFAAIGLAGCYKAVMFGMEAVKGYSLQYMICQKDYENFETESYEIQGITFYVPAEGDRTGYDAFPSSPVKAAAELRGAKLKDGFRYKK